MRNIRIKLLLLLSIVSILYCEKDNRINYERHGDYRFNIKVRPENKYQTEYNELARKIWLDKRLNRLCYKNWPSAHFYINEFFTFKDAKGRYAKVDAISIQIEHQVKSGTYKSQLFTEAEVLASIGINTKDIEEYIDLMKKLKVKAIFKRENYIEFSDFVYMDNSSVDLYNGYLFSLEGQKPDYDTCWYEIVEKLNKNCFYFLRTTRSPRSACWNNEKAERAAAEKDGNIVE